LEEASSTKEKKNPNISSPLQSGMERKRGGSQNTDYKEKKGVVEDFEKKSVNSYQWTIVLHINRGGRKQAELRTVGLRTVKKELGEV